MKIEIGVYFWSIPFQSNTVFFSTSSYLPSCEQLSSLGNNTLKFESITAERLQDNRCSLLDLHIASKNFLIQPQRAEEACHVAVIRRVTTVFSDLRYGGGARR